MSSQKLTTARHREMTNLAVVGSDVSKMFLDDILRDLALAWNMHK